MEILIADDETLARERLRRLLTEIPDCEVVGEAVNGDDALRKIEVLDPSLVFLDIRMPGSDGMSTARALSEMNDPPAVVFCTAYDEYALQAFDTLAVGYLLKPVQRDDLQKVVEKAKKLNKAQLHAARERQNGAEEERRQHISARSHRGMELIPLEKIFCFTADQKYVTVHHSDGETLIDETLKELEEEFDDYFVRVHRNALVSIQQIAAMERDASGSFYLRLKASEFKPQVSRRHLPGVRDLLDRI